jgi:hypothetical protein
VELGSKLDPDKCLTIWGLLGLDNILVWRWSQERNHLQQKLFKMLKTNMSTLKRGALHGPLGGGAGLVPWGSAEAGGKSPLIDIGVSGQGGKESGKGEKNQGRGKGICQPG